MERRRGGQRRPLGMDEFRALAAREQLAGGRDAGGARSAGAGMPPVGADMPLAEGNARLAGEGAQAAGADAPELRGYAAGAPYMAAGMPQSGTGGAQAAADLAGAGDVTHLTGGPPRVPLHDAGVGPADPAPFYS